MRSSLLAACMALSALAVNAQPAGAPLPSRPEVEAALKEVRKDPNLPGTEKKRTLVFKDLDRKPDKAKKDDASLPGWLLGFGRWVTEAGRVFVWMLGAVLVALLLVGLRHWVRARADARPLRPGPRPSHVRDLDIRPESLPDRIGAAARALWQGGEHRPALSLLYRGALSRLVHQHAVPIRAASTEGDCLKLARSRLDDARLRFFERLVAAWQLAVYGGRLPEAALVLALCDEFDARWAVAFAAEARK